MKIIREQTTQNSSGHGNVYSAAFQRTGRKKQGKRNARSCSPGVIFACEKSVKSFGCLESRNWAIIPLLRQPICILMPRPFSNPRPTRVSHPRAAISRLVASFCESSAWCRWFMKYQSGRDSITAAQRWLGVVECWSRLESKAQFGRDVNRWSYLHEHVDTWFSMTVARESSMILAISNLCKRI